MNIKENKTDAKSTKRTERKEKWSHREPYGFIGAHRELFGAIWSNMKP